MGHEEKKRTLILLSICLGACFTDQPFWAAAFICVSTALQETGTLGLTVTALPDGQSRTAMTEPEQGLGQLHPRTDGHMHSKGQSC